MIEKLTAMLCTFAVFLSGVHGLSHIACPTDSWLNHWGSKHLALGLILTRVQPLEMDDVIIRPPHPLAAC